MYVHVVRDSLCRRGFFNLTRQASQEVGRENGDTELKDLAKVIQQISAAAGLLTPNSVTYPLGHTALKGDLIRIFLGIRSWILKGSCVSSKDGTRTSG